MVTYRRAAVAVMALVLTGAFAAPTIAQTGPYQPEEPPPEEPAAEESEVEGEVIEAPEEPEGGVDEESTEVREATLVRTGSDTMLLVTAGLLALGLGVLIIRRSRHRGRPKG